MSSPEVKKKEPGMVMLIAVLAGICLVMATILGMFNNLTLPLIDANTAEKTRLALEEVLPISSGEYTEVPYEGDAPFVTKMYAAGDEGYVVETTNPNGFSGNIVMVTGITNDGTVNGISIVTHAETSGLGANATKPEWRALFVGATEDVFVTKDGGTIESIIGSTITSRAVCDSVNSSRTAALEMVG